ncbi:MAG: (d)CMP kinase [Actinomycetota bacterium]
MLLPTDAELTVIAIDGPAGSGKSTVARLLADRLDLDYLDTGAMYRSVTWAVLQRGVAPDAGTSVAAVAREIDIDLAVDGSVVVDGTEVTAEIRSAAVSQAVSAVAANQAVRAELVNQQRDWTRKRGGGVLEGRDIGSVVFPEATLKVYLTASTEARAARRARDEHRSDEHAVAADLQRRDKLDSERTHDPLRQVADAVIVDTTDLSIDQVVEYIAELVDGR